GVFLGTTLTSNKAIFTQTDIGKVITVDGVQGSVIIQKWKKVPSAPCTQVTINPPLTLRGEKVFHITQRDSGIIDVTMAAFPNQYVTMAIGTSGSLLDKYVDWNANPKAPKGGEADPDNYMARQIGQLARAKYDTFYPRFMVQENSISAYMPVYPGDLIHGDRFTLLKEVAADGGLVGGQDLWYCYEDPDYRMNRGSNCDRNDPDCPHE